MNVDFYTFDDVGEKISLNGDQRRTTDINIRKVIGTYDDFIMTVHYPYNLTQLFLLIRHKKNVKTY